MFTFSGRFYYKLISTPENNNQGEWAALVTFNSDDVLFVPFTKDKEHTNALIAVNDVCNFNTGLYGSIEISGDRASIEARIDEIRTRIRAQLNAGAGIIDYANKPPDFTEQNATGNIADW